MQRALLAACTLATAAAGGAVLFAHAKELAVTIADLQAPQFSAQSLRASLSGKGLRELNVEIDKLSIAGRTWRKVKVACPEADVTAVRIACARAVVEAGEKIPVSFSYGLEQRDLELEVRPAPDELWRLTGRLGGSKGTLQLKLERGRMERVASWLPEGTPKISAGRASGTITLEGSALNARLDLEGLAFADAKGLRAGEKVAASLEATGAETNGEWRWTTRLMWRSGEVFWQPVFVAARGQRLSVQGTTAKGATALREGQLELPGIGTVGFNGRWDHAAGAFSALEAQSSRLRVGPLYEEILKPLLQQTALADLRAEGDAAASLMLGREGLTAFDLDLTNVSFEDHQRRFALFGLTGHVPWRRDEASKGEIAFKGAELLKLPIGAVRAPLRMRGSRVAIDSIRLPILDGALSLRDITAGPGEKGWEWRLASEISPISMVQLTHTLGIPVMHGSLAGVIPGMRYRSGTLAVDGTLLIRVFDGTIKAENVELIDAFGRAPRLHSDIEMKNLDLDLLTRAFDFGTITGRVDARVRGLELVNWQPTRFDARIESSAGDYPRKISQRAVQNISALGGAGAAAAIQRSLLRFFEQFGYEKLGLSCRLENQVCEMDGIERAPQGYVIVKGGGIPAISVIGYNRSVSWRELLDRLKRITQDNVKPIVK